MGMQVSGGETGSPQNGERAAILRAALLALPPQARRLPRLAVVEPFLTQSPSRFSRIAARKAKDNYWANADTETTEAPAQRSAEIIGPSSLWRDRRHLGINRAAVSGVGEASGDVSLGIDEAWRHD